MAASLAIESNAVKLSCQYDANFFTFIYKRQTLGYGWLAEL